MSGDVHVRFCERLEGRFLRATRLIIGCQHEEDARRIMKVLPKRFDRFGLTVHPEKTKLIPFARPAFGKEASQGEGTFDFLGLTHYWAKSLKGNWVIKRKTASKKVRKTMAAMREWCRNNPAQARDVAIQDTLLKAAGPLSVFWNSMQHACNGSGAPLCDARLEILAEPKKP